LVAVTLPGGELKLAIGEYGSEGVRAHNH